MENEEVYQNLDEFLAAVMDKSEPEYSTDSVPVNVFSKSLQKKSTASIMHTLLKGIDKIENPEGIESPIPEQNTEYETILIYDSRHELVNTIVVDVQASTITMYLPEGLTLNTYNKGKIARNISQGIYSFSTRGLIDFSMNLQETYACKWYSPSITAAAQNHLTTSEFYEFDKLASFGSCSNPVVIQNSGTGDLVPCMYEQMHWACDESAYSETFVDVTLKTDKGTMVTIEKDRMGLGSTRYTVKAAKLNFEPEVLTSVIETPEEHALDELGCYITVWTSEANEVIVDRKKEELVIKEGESYFDSVFELSN